MQLEQLRRLPRQASEIWQGGVMPAALFDESNVPHSRAVFEVDPEVGPFVGYWLSLTTGRSYTSDSAARGRSGPVVAMDALVHFASDFELAGYRPGQVVIADETIGQYLEDQLAQVDIQVVFSDDAQMARQIVTLMQTYAADDPLLTELENLSQLFAKNPTSESETN